MQLGYNTNGLAHHSLPAAIRLLATLGYQSIAITVDHCALNPYAVGFEKELGEIRELLVEHDMRSVIETGARFLLDPMHKHEPTLLAAQAELRVQRIEFLCHAVDVAVALGSDCVSLWAGVLPENATREGGFARLVEGLQTVLQYADSRDVSIGFEPEPGMLIDTMASYGELVERVDSSRLGLTLDIGHLHCLGEPIEPAIVQWSDRLLNVHLEDMRVGVHDHLMFGEGEIDFPPVMSALKKVGYTGGVHVELSRHSHMGPVAARQSFDFLSGLV